MFRLITMDYDAEHGFANLQRLPGKGLLRPSICAVAQWIQKIVERGNIQYPVHFRATADYYKGVQTGEVSIRCKA